MEYSKEISVHYLNTILDVDSVYTHVYTLHGKGGREMEYAKVFTNGGSQAVRLPKTCRFKEREVMVKRIGNAVLLMQKDDPWASMLAGLELFTDDYLGQELEDLPVQERSGL